MLIESTDGRYYSNPVWTYLNCVIQTLDECLYVDVPKDTKFSLIILAKKLDSLMKKNGFKGDLVDMGESKVIIADSLTDCHRFQLFAKQPVPPPHRYDVFTDTPLAGAYVKSIKFPITTIMMAMQGLPEQGLRRLLGENYKATIRRQLPWLQGARITNENYNSYVAQCLERYGPHPCLTRKDLIQL